MNYQRIYNEIIERAKLRGLNKKKLEYFTERHHIIPKCLNGTNDKDNLVLLTGREHYLCHWLLWKANKENQKLFFAIWRMRHGKQQKYFNLSSKQYEQINLFHSNIQKKRIGVLSPNFGKKRTEESKERMRIAHLGKTITEETRNKLKEVRKTRIFSEETKEKMRKSSIGKTHSDEAKLKMRNAKLGTHRTEETKLKIGLAFKEIWKQRKLNKQVEVI